MKKIFLFLLILLLAPLSFAIAPEPSSTWNKSKELRGKEYMLVTALPLASEVAVNIIEEGGNAIDAAIAAQMVLNLVEPQSSGIGGGGFMLYYDAKGENLTSYDGRETAPLNTSSDIFLNEEGNSIKFINAVRSAKAIGAPGLLAMLDKAHKQHGKFAWAELFRPAINIAKEGFPISERLHISIEYASSQNVSEEFRELYLNENGEAKKEGEIFKNPQFSNVLGKIAKHGADYFYQEDLAEDIVSVVKKNGGDLRESDLENYKAKEKPPICLEYREYNVCGMGLPSSGGVTTLQTLGILENFKLQNAYAPSEMHLISEAQKLVYADRNYYLADDDFVEVPSYEELLDKKYLAKRADSINKNKASKIKAKPGFFEQKNANDNSYDAPSTTHISIIDKEGNAVSLTSSVEHSFGSGFLTHGFILNNQLTDFAFKPKQDGKIVANSIEGGKRPRSSMAPTMIFDKDGNLYAVLGSPGGSSIIPYVTKTIIGLIDWNMGLLDIISRPHFMNKNKGLELEEGQKELAEDLKVIGHLPKFKKFTSGINAILLKDGVIIGAADPRREGVAEGK